jgi:4-amino-4-deoxy-L-arabinose transferase-like glycosyltransferase
MSNATTRTKARGAYYPKSLLAALSNMASGCITGPPSQPRWERPALLSLLLMTSLLYCWGLNVNGWANAYYSAAAMSGAQDWTAFFYGSSDPANAITVDKPPMSIWVMALSVRLFGLSSWSILLPQALMGLLTVYLLYSMVRRHFGAPMGLLAAALMAVTPVSTVMFRYNNPDALLILIMVAITFAILRTIDEDRPSWLLLAGALVGAGFLTKQLQIGLILPALIVTFLLFSRISWPVRLLTLSLAGLAAVAVAGSWLLAVQLADPALRPFIGGSTHNSALELALGYNGLDRLTGDAANQPLSGSTHEEKLTSGYLRFLEPGFTGQFGWFLPLAVAGLVTVAIRVYRRGGTTAQRAFLLFNGLWFVTSATVVAFMSGIVHPYYTLIITPSCAVLAAVALRSFITNRHSWHSRFGLVLTMLVTMTLAFVSAARSTSEFPGLSQVLLAAWAVVIALQLVSSKTPSSKTIPTAALIAVLVAGPIIWSINTVLSPHVGAGVSAGPSLNGKRTDHPDRQRFPSDVPPSFSALMLGDLPLSGISEVVGSAPPTVKWASAMVGSESAANYQLDLKRPILAIGGFNGTDPFPTLDLFQKYVANGELGSLVIQNLPVTSEGQEDEAGRIVHWVRTNYPAQVIDGAEFYNFLLK